MDLERIRELLAMMVENDLSELEISDGDQRIVLKRGAGLVVSPQVIAVPQTALPSSGVAGAAEPVPGKEGEESTGENFVEIKSPIVGTFYAAPSPNAEPFVEMGSRVEEDTVVGTIEAMKVMNEIKSEIKGTIKKVLVSNGAAVEYGQALFQVEPD